MTKRALLRYNTNNKNILWGGVQFPTGSIVCEGQSFAPESVQFRYRRYSPDEIRMFEGGFLRPSMQGFCLQIFTPQKGAFFMLENEKAVAGTQSPTKNEKKVVGIKQRFSAKRLVLMAVFVALSYVVSFLEIPIFPAAGFLKLDFANVFILLISFLLGPVEGVIVCLLKEGLRAIGSSSGGVGELANIIMTSSYILLPAIVYRFHKGLKMVIPCLLVACVIGTVTALVANRFITFPLYMGAGAKAAFQKFFYYVLAFNLIKTSSVSILTILLYKRLSNFLKKWKI